MEVIGSNSVNNAYNTSLQNLSKAVLQLASGKSIFNPSDNPAGLAISEDMALEISGDTAANNNMSNANNFINTADSYMQSAQDMVGRMSELSIQMNDSTLNANDQQAISAEYSALNNEVNNVFNTSQYNGLPIFGQAVTLATDSNGGQFTIGVNALGNLAGSTPNTLTAGTATAVNAALQTASANISTQRANLGAAQSQLQYMQSSLVTNIVNTQASNSSISDLDMAQGAMSMTQNQILNQASLAMMAQANLNARNVLSLL